MLPEELKLALASLIGFVVTEGLKALFPNKDLSSIVKVVSAALFTGLVMFADGLLALVPAEYQGVVGGVISLIVALLGAFGLHRVYKNTRSY